MFFRMESLGIFYHWTQHSPNGSEKPMGIGQAWAGDVGSL